MLGRSIHICQKVICMVFRGDRIKELLAGEKLICDTCNAGVLQPLNPNVPTNIQTVFICDNCGEKVHLLRSFADKPECLKCKPHI